MSWKIRKGDIYLKNNITGDYGNEWTSDIEVLGNSCSDVITINEYINGEIKEQVSLDIHVFEEIAKKLVAKGAIDV